MKLCIYPGHGFENVRAGRYDSGATYNGTAEADITLQWGITGKWLAKELGVPVWLTRTSDTDPAPVGSRDDRAELAGCTHFLAVHCNSFDGTATGTETLYRDSQDLALAEMVQRAALDTLKLKDRGVKPEGASQHSRLAVFDFDGPACLVELGFIDRYADRNAMLERDNRIAFWAKVYKSLFGIERG